MSIKCFRLFFGIAHTTEYVQFPTGGHGQRVTLRSLVRIEAAHCPLRGKRKGGQESKFGGHQRCLSFFHAKQGGLVVGIGPQPCLAEGLQMRVGEEFPPVHIPQTGSVFRHHFPAVKIVGDGSGGLVFGIDATTAQRQTHGN